MLVSSILLPSLALLIAYYLIYKIPKNKSTKEHPDYNPSNTVFVFDIHGVICKFSFTKVIQEAWKIPNKGRLIIILCNPKLWYHSIKTYQKYSTPEALFIKVSEKYTDLKPYKKHMINVLNSQTIVPSTMRLVKDLYEFLFGLSTERFF